MQLKIRSGGLFPRAESAVKHSVIVGALDSGVDVCKAADVLKDF